MKTFWIVAHTLDHEFSKYRRFEHHVVPREGDMVDIGNRSDYQVRTVTHTLAKGTYSTGSIVVSIDVPDFEWRGLLEDDGWQDELP